MTWILELAAANWKVVLIAFLSAALLLSIKVGNGVRVEYETEKVKWSIQVAQAAAAQKEVEVRSQKTLEKMNAYHETALASGRAAAQTNYSHLLAQSLANRAAVGVRPVSSDPAATPSHFTDGSGISDAAVESVMADPTARLINDCADTATQVVEFQSWVRLNHLPVEGE